MTRWIMALIRIALGGIFIYAAWHKLLRPDQFADAINNYRILPYFLVNLAAITLPWIEVMFGLFLIFNFKTSASAMAVNMMMIAFIAGLVSAWSRGIDISCGCFSMEGEPISYHELVRDLVFLAMSVSVYVYALKKDRALKAEQPA